MAERFVMDGPNAGLTVHVGGCEPCEGWVNSGFQCVGVVVWKPREVWFNFRFECICIGACKPCVNWRMSGLSV